MPVMDTSHDDSVEAPTLARERPQARGTRPGVWRTLAHGITLYLTPTPRTQHAHSRRPCQPFEAPMDRLVQEHVSLSLLALAIL